MSMVTVHDLAAYVACCVGRRDRYALQQPDGRYRAVAASLTADLIYHHLQGALTLGSYVIREDGLCPFAVFDADTLTGLTDLAHVQLMLSNAGIPSYLEASRRGAHLRVFLREPVHPALLRRWLLPYAPVGVEFYPKQDTASYEHPGSLMRLPLGVHQVTGQRYPFVQMVEGYAVPVCSSVRETLDWLATIQWAVFPGDQVRELAVLSSSSARQAPFPASDVALSEASRFSGIRDWCMQHDALSVIGRYVDLDPDGMGCCPFGWHHNAGCDRHPSLWVYIPRYPDVRCWYCHTWQQGGSLFDFLRLYYALEPRELWHQLLSGAQF